MLSAIAAEVLARPVRSASYSDWLCAAAGFCTTGSAWAAVQLQKQSRTQGDLPRAPTLPQRSLLLRKLVVYERSMRHLPPQEADPLSHKQQVRAARRAATQQYMTAVNAAAAHQDIHALLQHLTAAAPPPQQAQHLVPLPVPAAAGFEELPRNLQAGTAGQYLPGSGQGHNTVEFHHLCNLGSLSGSLLPAATAAAVRKLAETSGRPEPAQVFLEMALDRQLLQPQQAGRALHAVLQAYAGKGDHRGVLAAAARFYDIGTPCDSNSSRGSRSCNSSTDGSRGYDSKALLPSGSKFSSCTLALILNSAAATNDPDLLLGAWRYFFIDTQAAAVHGLGYEVDAATDAAAAAAGSRDSTGSSSSSSRGSLLRRACATDILPPANVLHALVHGAISCDLAAADLQSSSSSATSSSSLLQHWDASPGDTAINAGLPQLISAVLLQPDSSTVEVLRHIESLVRQANQVNAQQHQKQRQRSQRQQQQPRQPRPFLLPPLLQPDHARELLDMASSAADVDLLLLSQLYQSTGLGVDALLKLVQLRQQQRQQQQRIATSSAALASSAMPSGSVAAFSSIALSSSTASFGSISAGSAVLATPVDLLLQQSAAVKPTALPDSALQVNTVPQFPPRLRADVAHAAVAAYIKHGAYARAAAVAHAALLDNPRDVQQCHLFIKQCAAAGQYIPAWNMMHKMREYLWQMTTPTAQAAMLRTFASSAVGPPMGASPSVPRLVSFFRHCCTPHPKTWGALLQGLVTAGRPSQGTKLWTILKSAMSQPYNHMAMAKYSPQMVDKARSQIVAALMRSILAQPPGDGQRLGALTAAAAAAASTVDSNAGGLLAASMSGSEQAAAAGISKSTSSISGSTNRDGSSDQVLWVDRMYNDNVRGLIAVQQTPTASLHLTRVRAAGPQWHSHKMLEQQQQSTQQWLWQHNQQQQQQPLQGVPLKQQPVHIRQQVLLVLSAFDVLGQWGVRFKHDAALAAALQALRYCRDTDDAWQSGLLVALLRGALSLGIEPSKATLRGLLSCCRDLESRPGNTPLGLAKGPTFKLDGFGDFDMGHVLHVCQQAINEQEQLQQQVSVDSSGGGSSSSSNGSEAARQSAADVLRTLAFRSTFQYVEGTVKHGPTWPLTRKAAAANQMFSSSSSSTWLL